MTEALDCFTSEGLLGGVCGSCGRRHFPVAPWCPWCGGDVPTEVVLSTTGTLWSWTAVLVAPPGSLGEAPYGFGIVELPADGLRVVARLTEADPARLSVGQAMRFCIVPLADGVDTWAFEPA